MTRFQIGSALCGSLLLAQPALAQNFKYEFEVGFPDFNVTAADPAYRGPVFVLSDSYPSEEPALDSDVSAILGMDFENDPNGWALSVRDYIFKGNIHGGDVEDDFVLQANSAGIDWYHAPWQHWGETGREAYHGLTREGPLSAEVLAPSQSDASFAYAVGFYNAPGGFAFGQVWPSANAGPNLDYFIENGNFPDGTIVGKFLFTVLDEAQVPYLQNPLQWKAYMYDCDVPSTGQTCPSDMSTATRSTQMVNLLQMDIMVKDPRATDAAGWVFGTFVYNGGLPADSPYHEGCKDFGAGMNWCNLMPVGVMWGNDPDVRMSFVNDKPTETVINADLTQTWINPDSAMPAMHLGFNSRLNGPADNPASSCMSCHSTSQQPAVSPILAFLAPNNPTPPNGTEASDRWMRWFRNFEEGETFDPDTISLDFSLQMSKAIQNYLEFIGETQQGGFAIDQWDGQNAVRRNAPSQ
ncbi:hypothetical protein [Anianabacter salinae]|uniref:hypothetical protein n=1 Tax=Anianabacter salinae TaxID=2851023 RepID=UPI00225DED18|nr:hypothetical protein [Anianabacter salinae]MBV0913180.1 hypothetical protein [Anianabacter salinae]